MFIKVKFPIIIEKSGFLHINLFLKYLYNHHIYEVIYYRILNNQYSIAVFGQFKDVSASDFFQVQIDTDYRKEWDSNSVELQVVDSDTLSNSDILYWEFLFPVGITFEYLFIKKRTTNGFSDTTSNIRKPNIPVYLRKHR